MSDNKSYHYVCIASHGVWTIDGKRYLHRHDTIESLEQIPSGYHHRFAVVEKPKVDEFARKPETEVAED